MFYLAVNTKEQKFYECVQSLSEMYGVMKQEHFTPPDQAEKADEYTTILHLFNERLDQFLAAARELFHSNKHLTTHIWALIKVNRNTITISKVALQAMSVTRQAHLQVQYQKIGEISESMNGYTTELKQGIRLDQWIESINIYIGLRINEEDAEDQIIRLLSTFAEEYPEWVTQTKQLSPEQLPNFKKQFEILFQTLAQRIKGSATQNLLDHYKVLEEVDRFFKGAEEDSLAKKMRVFNARFSFHQARIVASPNNAAEGRSSCKALMLLNDALQDILAELEKKPDRGSRLVEIRNALQLKISHLDDQTLYPELNQQRKASKENMARLNRYVGSPVLRLENPKTPRTIYGPSGVPHLYRELVELYLIYQQFYLSAKQDEALLLTELNQKLKKVFSTSMSDYPLLPDAMKKFLLPSLVQFYIALQCDIALRVATPAAREAHQALKQTCERMNLYLESLKLLQSRNSPPPTPLNINLFEFAVQLFKMAYLPIRLARVEVFEPPKNEAESRTFCKILDNLIFFIKHIASLAAMDTGIFNHADAGAVKLSFILLVEEIKQNFSGIRRDIHTPYMEWKEKRNLFQSDFDALLRRLNFNRNPSDPVENELDRLKKDLERVLSQGINPYPAINYLLNPFKQTFDLASGDWMRLSGKPVAFQAKFAAIYRLLSPIHASLLEFINDGAISEDDSSIRTFLSNMSLLEEVNKRLKSEEPKEEGPLSQIRTLLKSSSYLAVNRLLKEAKVGGLEGFVSWLQKPEEERKPLSGFIQELKEMLAPYSHLDAPHDGKEVSEFLYNCVFIRTMSQTCEGKIEFQAQCLKLIPRLLELSKIAKQCDLAHNSKTLEHGIKNVIGCFYDSEFTELEALINQPQLPPEWKAILCKHLDCITKDLIQLSGAERHKLTFIDKYIKIFSKIVKNGG